MNKKHMLLMLACCLIPLIALGAVSIFHVPFNQVLIYGMILLCPISMFLMMRGMMNGENHEHSAEHHQSHFDDKVVDSHWTSKDTNT